MNLPAEFTLNDHRFLQILSCPLKIPFLFQDSSLGGPPDVYRQKNKLKLRDAVATRFKHCRHTSDDLLAAAKETETWLREPEVAICGAVIKTGSLLTRIPILVKEEEQYTIIQVHGKLRKRSEQAVLLNPARKRSTAIIALKAAYRAEVLGGVAPGAKIFTHLYFPQKAFKAAKNGLHHFGAGQNNHKEAFGELFVKVDAATAVEAIRAALPGVAVHSAFAGLGLREAIHKITGYKTEGNYKVKHHSGCVHCPYRKSDGESKGCWEIHFNHNNIQKKEHQVPDLIGNGNSVLLQQGIYFQEEIQMKDGFHDFDLMKQFGGAEITIQQRRGLQILRAREKKNPLLWIKKEAGKLTTLPFPLHFIDFEAAAYAIPMRRGDRPYSPLYFQFSCHTLYANGTIKHSGWLHKKPETGYIHHDFVARLSEIPDIYQGTIVHYSPFEKQAIYKVFGEFQRSEKQHAKELYILERFLHSREETAGRRFADLSEFVKRYYYNSFMTNSLGLKDILQSVLTLEQMYPDKIRNHERNNQATIRKEFPDQLHPYQDAQNGKMAIMDGASAMHAWIAQKNGLLNKQASEEINRLLLAYCEIDSLAMVFLYKHILRHLSEKPENDTILF